ncbi:MAG TPA: metallophosphoesterase [Phycisphaerae bacterium]|nr:metallophosphoesterase [Phycisphaerae bacterium]HRR84135.1 metallophosphoesterase [Phycisphaerae bacterium]
MKSFPASLKACLDRHPAGPIVLALVIACVLAVTVGCNTPATRFVVISDLHPAPGAFDQLEAMTDHVIRLRPAFAVVLGDIGNDEVPGVSEEEIETIRKSFNRMTAAGIEIYPVMGNHDVHHRVQDIKVNWFLAQTPRPLNHLFNQSAQTPAYQAFQARGPYNYSFNRGGIHFAVVDSNISPPRPDWPAERLARERPQWEAHLQWMKDDFCRHVNNPRRLPTLVFLHHPEYLTGDRGMDSRPLGRVLEECRDEQTVMAAFGGHWHGGANLAPKWKPNLHVYATQASVHPATRPVEFIVAEVTAHGLTLEPRDSVTGQPGTGPVKYYPIAGRFTDLRR